MDVSVFTVLRDPEFLRGYGLFLAQIAIVSIIGGALGVGAGALIYPIDWFAKALRRLLRLGMWLPFFVLGGQMHWGDRTIWNLNIHSCPILGAVVAASPAMVLASCYYYLCLRGVTDLDRVQRRFQLLRAIVFQALLVCLLWQLFSACPRPWPWASFAKFSYDPAVAYPFAFVLGLIVLAMNLLSSSTLDRTATLRGRIIAHEVERSKVSNFGTMLILGICLIFWLVFNQWLREMFFIGSPKEVLRAVYQLSVTGIQGMKVPAFNGQTMWKDIGVSLSEVLGGIGLAGVVGFAVSKALEKAPPVPKTISFYLLSISYITPIALWQALFPWVGLGISHKIVLIACLTFFPVVETLWIFRETPVLVRIAIAIDEALPIAFVGMILGELWAATAGIGFFIVVTKSMSHFAESTAMALLGFVLLVVISLALRYAVKSVTSEMKLSACLRQVSN